MAMNQKQRDHFIDRVREKCKSRITSLKAIHAAEIHATAETKYHEFVNALGLKEDMNTLQTAEDIWDEQVDKIKSILNGLKDLNPDASSHSLNYQTRSAAHREFKDFLMGCCKYSAEKEFYNTPAGQELKNLETTQNEAIDTIMMDGSKVQELTLKLNTILGKSDIQLIEESTRFSQEGEGHA